MFPIESTLIYILVGASSSLNICFSALTNCDVFLLTTKHM
jgi:hypothetical protein